MQKVSCANLDEPRYDPVQPPAPPNVRISLADGVSCCRPVKIGTALPADIGDSAVDEPQPPRSAAPTSDAGKWEPASDVEMSCIQPCKYLIQDCLVVGQHGRFQLFIKSGVLRMVTHNPTLLGVLLTITANA